MKHNYYFKLLMVNFLPFDRYKVYYFAMTKTFKALLLVIFTTHANYAGAFLDKNEIILSASEAFIISGYEKNDSVFVSWLIEDGYYMYKKSFKFINSNQEYDFKILNSNETTFSDEYFGETQIFKGKLALSLELDRGYNKENILLYFQGCSESGFCYPLQELKLSDIIF